ncbi:MAG: tetrahydromethanopterin S-methyltransferase [Candidatus Lokiarchaeota archaeon]|nr:tetrahydromethanopterin S-methyltransferase [Candidatus Lokiarchaeota archaeon]
MHCLSSTIHVKFSRNDLWIILTDYKKYYIAGNEIGGDYTVPTLLISSIFYSGHDIVSDSERGVFDEEKARKLIGKQLECSELFNIPTCLDIIAETPEAMSKYLHFIKKEFFGPIIIDGFVDARIEGLKVAKDLGLMNRVIYNSIWKNQKKELEVMKEVGLKTAILFAYDVANTSAMKRFKVVTEGTSKYDDLFSIAKSVGINQFLIDNVLTTEFYSLSDAIEANIMFKSIYGYPVGCGPANINYGLSKSRLPILDKKMVKMIREASVNTLAQIFSDFILIGPIERIEKAAISADIVNKIIKHLNFDPFDILKQG